MKGRTLFEYEPGKYINLDHVVAISNLHGSTTSDTWLYEISVTGCEQPFRVLNAPREAAEASRNRLLSLFELVSPGR